MFHFGSFSSIATLTEHVSALERENESLKRQLIENERAVHDEKTELIATCSKITEKLKGQIKDFEVKLETLERERNNMSATLESMRDELAKKRRATANGKAKKATISEERKLLEDERSLSEALSNKLQLAETRLAESQITVDLLQREAQKILALRAILIAELNEQFEAGRKGGYKCFAKRAYEFLERFRQGLIDDLIGKT
jgi:predicted RNase H-like nuclease (RuvC/YqgF family)